MAGNQNRLSRFWQELKRRRVIHVIAVYASAAFVIIELAGNLTEPLNLPTSLSIIVIIVLAVGFPLAIVLSWLYDLTSGTFERTKPIENIQAGEKAKVPNAWKIATYVSFLVIAGLLVFNIVTRGDIIKPGTHKSIAVLPFENLNDDQEQEYFSEGLVEEILNRLCRISGLKVISKTSSAKFKDSDLSLEDIADQLSVSAIMEGSVQKSGNRIRIAVQLIDAETDTHLWSNIFEQDYSDIFSIYNTVAQAVAGELKTVITPKERHLIEKYPTSDMIAYDAFLKGSFYLGKLTEEDLDIAMQYYELAKKRDPDFALAYSGIASVWICRQQMGIVEVSEASPLSEAAIKKALSLDSNLSEVHTTLAGRRVWTDWDWAGGEEAFTKAIDINPNNAGAHSSYSHLLNIIGRADEAMAQIEIALELDPLNPMIWSFYGIDLMFVRRFDEAVTAFRRAMELSPQQGVALSNLDVALYRSERDPQEVMDALRNKYIAINESDFINLLENSYSVGGWPLLHKKIAELRVERLDSVYSDPLTISNCYTLAGDIDNAMYWMQKAYEQHDPNLPYLLLPSYDILRDDPRFQEIARKMNLPYESFD